jgi:predicted DNA-binding transcriptional regulator AlpA
MSVLNELGLTRMSRLPAIVDCSKSTLYKKIQEGLFLKPLSFGRGFSAIPNSELIKYFKGLVYCNSETEIKDLVKEIQAGRNQGGKR